MKPKINQPDNVVISSRRNVGRLPVYCYTFLLATPIARYTCDLTCIIHSGSIQRRGWIMINSPDIRGF
ncbi:hypothetical protein BFC17_13955 [Alteromonas lipolytica]|uniref:Uncharacterized protein n=1 Tax=Alteromonas lipolytica TaxID=1856405 RepID=A0A1E8FGV0_9ALTE|nr:hypothetical protein BFC17_13955 [Alteromonas lipolytica]